MNTRMEIVGVGRTKNEEQWTFGLVDLAVKAADLALKDAGIEKTSAVIVANSLGGALGDQRNLGAFVASRLGFGTVEAQTVSCDEASGGGAIRTAMGMVKAGMHETILVVGAEKTSDTLPDMLEAVRATGLDAVREAGFGFGPAVAAGLGMQRYLSQYNTNHDLFYHLAEVAHTNAAGNPLSFFSWPLSFEQYKRSPKVADPLTVCDSAPLCDGAAAVIIRATPSLSTNICIIGSAAASAPTGIASPVSKLYLPASAHSAKTALAEAGLTINDLSLLELHDSSSFMAALSIESVGLAKRGEALQMAKDGIFGRKGQHPLWTMGGLKARGNPPGAGGIFQMVEATLQLRNCAKINQINNAKTAFVQCLGSFGSTAVTHVLG